MADARKVLFAPNGSIIDLESVRQNDRIELRAGLMEWLYQAGLVFKTMSLGIHCAKCGADLIGKNADTDKVFSATCGCREFVGPNRYYRAPTSH